MTTKDLGMVTAYAYAVMGGYEGTEAEFEALLGNIATDLEEIENLTVIANTLPEGSSATASYADGVLTLGIPKGDTGATGAGATATVGTTTTGDPGTNASVTNSGTTKDAVFNFTIPRGATGNGIESIYLTGTSGAVKTYTILFTDGNTTTFDVTDGEVTNASLAEVLEDYAKTDGAYESMTVGNAEQLISSVTVNDKVPYNFRTSGGSIDIGNREVDKLVGGTVAWNQLIVDGNFSEGLANWQVYSGTGSVSNGALTVAGATGRNGVRAGENKQIIAGHKYLCGFTYTATVRIEVNMCYSPRQYAGATNTPTRVENIFSAISSAGVKTDIFPQDIGAVGDFTIQNIQCIDLTQMFGSTIADYIYSLEQATAGAGVAWFKKLFPKPYYAYNAGQLMSVKTSAHQMVGFNQWDEEWEVGALNADGTTGTSTTQIRSKYFCKCVPSTSYYVKCGNNSGRYWLGVWWYDENKDFISFSWENGRAVTSPANARYFKVGTNNNSSYVYGTTYNHDICINLHWDGERDGEYEAYKKWTYPLDSDLELRGIPKLDASNNLYYDGDTYEDDGTVTRNYGYRAYEAGDESLANAITDGTHTAYKLNTPTTETADPYQNPQIVDDFGTEEYVDERTVAIPVGHDTEYMNNLKAKLEMAPDSPDGDGDYIVRQTNGENSYVPLMKELPSAPSEDGTYTLKCTVASGTATLGWEREE